MMKLQDVKTGDTVVISPCSGHDLWKVAEVTAHTKTRFTAGGIQFNRRTGVKIGDADNWGHKTRIAENLKTYGLLMTPQEAETRNAERRVENHRLNLIITLRNLSRDKLESVSTDILEQVAKLLGVEQ